MADRTCGVALPDVSQDLIDLRLVDNVLQDVLNDIEGWEDKALAEAVTEARAKLQRVADRLLPHVTAGVNPSHGSQQKGGE